MNIKIICLSGMSAGLISDYLNQKNTGNHFSSMLIDGKSENEVVDLYILSPIFTRNIVQDFRKKVGEDKVIILTKAQYKDRDIILSIIEENNY